MAVKKKTRPSAKRSAAKATPKLTRYSKGEYIRVAPLHSPKPAMSIAELSTVRQEQSDAQLFDGHAPAASAAHLTYFGGPLATSAKSSKGRNPQICPWNSLPSLNWSSTSRRRRHLGSKFRPRC